MTVGAEISDQQVGEHSPGVSAGSNLMVMTVIARFIYDRQVSKQTQVGCILIGDNAPGVIQDGSLSWGQGCGQLESQGLTDC